VRTIDIDPGHQLGSKRRTKRSNSAANMRKAMIDNAKCERNSPNMTGTRDASLSPAVSEQSMALGVIGVVLLVGSTISLSYPAVGK
jgi:hypothetical protein